MQSTLLNFELNQLPLQRNIFLKQQYISTKFWFKSLLKMTGNSFFLFWSLSAVPLKPALMSTFILFARLEIET